MKKRILSLFMAATMLLSLLPIGAIPAFAAGETIANVLATASDGFSGWDCGGYNTVSVIGGKLGFRYLSNADEYDTTTVLTADGNNWKLIETGRMITFTMLNSKLAGITYEGTGDYEKYDGTYVSEATLWENIKGKTYVLPEKYCTLTFTGTSLSNGAFLVEVSDGEFKENSPYSQNFEYYQRIGNVIKHQYVNDCFTFSADYSALTVNGGSFDAAYGGEYTLSQPSHTVEVSNLGYSPNPDPNVPLADINFKVKSNVGNTNLVYEVAAYSKTTGEAYFTVGDISADNGATFTEVVKKAYNNADSTQAVHLVWYFTRNNPGLEWSDDIVIEVMGRIEGDPLPITLGEVKSHDPWDGKIDVKYTLAGLEADANYKVAFDVTADGQTQSFTSDAAKLTDGIKTTVINTTELFGKEISDPKAKVAVRLIKMDTAEPSGEIKIGWSGPTEFVLGVEASTDYSQYYLVGTINGADCGCGDDYESFHEEYRFNSDGTLTVTFTEDSYVFVKSSDNMHWLLLAFPQNNGNAVVISDGNSEAMGAPANVEITFTLVDNGNGTLTLSYETPHTHGEGDSAITFEKAITTLDELNDLFTNGGSGYLANDITATEGLTIAAEVTLCLNGKVLDLDGKGNITISTGAIFNLYDCDTTTVRYYDKDDTTGLWTLNTAKTSGDYSTTGGVITGGSADNGGGVYVDGGTINLNGGSISGNAGENGGGVYVKSGSSFIMNGGTISGNAAKSGGGGVYVRESDFNMNNGSITKNHVKNGAGNGVYVGTSGVFTMVGGSITGNTAVPNGNTRGGVYYSGTATVTLGGTAKITDNTVVEKSAEIINNVNVRDNSPFNIGTKTGSDNGNGVAAPTTGFNVGVTTKTAPTATAPVKITANGTAYDAKWFTPDNSDYMVSFNTDHLELTLIPPHTHGEGDSAVTFEKAWTDATKLPDTAGNYYLDTDVTLSETWNVPTGSTVNLCLNGHVIKMNGSDRRVIRVNGTLNLYDCGNTEHAGYIDADGLWHIGDTVPEGCTAKTIKGGIITGGNARDGGGVYTSGTFTMAGGNIIGNTAGANGGGVYVYNNGAFTMTGGIVTGNTAQIGGGVYCYQAGTTSLGGTAKVTDNTAGAEGSKVKSNVYLRNDKSITLGTKTALVDGNGVVAPASGFNVGVTTKNPPTASNPKAITTNGTADDAKWFTPDNAYYVVKFNTDHLELALHPHTPVKVNGQAATEEAPGWSDYYECSCGDCFEDAEGLIPIENLDDWKAQGGSGYIPSGKEIKAARETAKEWFENPLNSLCLGYYSSDLVEAAISGLDNITRVEDIEQYKADYISTLIEAREEAFEKNSYSAMKTEIEELCEALGFDNEKTAGILADFDEFISGEYNNETRTEAIDAISEKYGNAQNDAEKEKAVRELYFSVLAAVNSSWIEETTRNPDDINKALIRSMILFDDNDKIADAIESENLDAELMALLECYPDYASGYSKVAGLEEDTVFDTVYAALRNAVKASAELTKAKKAATEAIVNALPEYATDEAKAIAEQAAKDIEAAETVSKVEEIKSTAINEIQTAMADVCPHCGKVHKNIFYTIHCYLIRIFRWIVSNVQMFIC